MRLEYIFLSISITISLIFLLTGCETTKKNSLSISKMQLERISQFENNIIEDNIKFEDIWDESQVIVKKSRESNKCQSTIFAVLLLKNKADINELRKDREYIVDIYGTKLRENCK